MFPTLYFLKTKGVKCFCNGQHIELHMIQCVEYLFVPGTCNYLIVFERTEEQQGQILLWWIKLLLYFVLTQILDLDDKNHCTIYSNQANLCC